MWHGAQDVAIYALGLIGVDYKCGGDTPDTGLDCSGLVRHVFQQVTGVTLPRTAKDMSRLGTKVALADLQPGDLVFFNTRRFAFSHVGIYLGDNRFVHAPSPRPRGRDRARSIRGVLAEALQRRAPAGRRAAGAHADVIAPRSRAERRRPTPLAGARPSPLAPSARTSTP